MYVRSEDLRVARVARAIVFILASTIASGSKPVPVPDSAVQSGAPKPSGSPSASTDVGPTPPPALKSEHWEGKLVVGPGIQLRLVLHLSRGHDGSAQATVDSPDQGATGMRADGVTRDKQTLAFSLKDLGATYTGRVNAEGTQAVGDFIQGGATIALTMTRVTKPSEARRPQTPTPPFPYRAEEVTYANAPGGVTLAGTLTIPSGSGPFPAVILITGSGAEDRDETIFGHKPFLVLADDLTRKGVAVLRVDDRGVGGSTGSVPASTSEDFAGDVLAGISFLMGRKDIDPARIGLIGHSEGGIIAPMVALRSKNVAFIITLAGPGIPGAELLALQNTVMARAMGMREDELQRANALNQRLYAAVATAPDGKSAEAAVRPILTQSPGTPATHEAAVRELTSPWFRYFIKYDPAPALAKVKCSILALNGSKDMQVPPRENLAAIKKANPRASTVELPGLNHLFQRAQTGAPTEYATIEETFDRGALDAISGFVIEQTKR